MHVLEPSMTCLQTRNEFTNFEESNTKIIIIIIISPCPTLSCHFSRIIILLLPLNIVLLKLYLLNMYPLRLCIQHRRWKDIYRLSVQLPLNYLLLSVSQILSLHPANLYQEMWKTLFNTLNAASCCQGCSFNVAHDMMLTNQKGPPPPSSPVTVALSHVSFFFSMIKPFEVLTPRGLVCSQSTSSYILYENGSKSFAMFHCMTSLIYFLKSTLS